MKYSYKYSEKEKYNRGIKINVCFCLRCESSDVSHTSVKNIKGLLMNRES